MGIAAKRVAWLQGQKAPGRCILKLAISETLLVLSWTLFCLSLLRMITPVYLWLTPLIYVFVSAILTMEELADNIRHLNPLHALGITAVSESGETPGEWRTLLRILFTPLFLLLFGSGFLPVLQGKISLPEKFSGLRIIPVNYILDPRSRTSLIKEQKKALGFVVFYIFFAACISILIISSFKDSGQLFTGGSHDEPFANVISREDQELLEIYLTASTQSPDSLCYHVRLASLYYRNSMWDDLEEELRIINGLDPDNPLLLLGEDLHIEFEDILDEEIAFADTTAHSVFFSPPPDTGSRQDSLNETSDSTIVSDTTEVTEIIFMVPDTIEHEMLDTLQSLQEVPIIEEPDEEPYIDETLPDSIDQEESIQPLLPDSIDQEESIQPLLPDSIAEVSEIHAEPDSSQVEVEPPVSEETEETPEDLPSEEEDSTAEEILPESTESIEPPESGETEI